MGREREAGGGAPCGSEKKQKTDRLRSRFGFGRALPGRDERKTCRGGASCRSRFGMRVRLVAAEGLHWIGMGRAASWYISGQQASAQYDCDRGRYRDRIRSGKSE